MFGAVSKVSNTVIVAWMSALFLSFGLVANFFYSEGLFYNLFQGIFISVFLGGVLYLARYLAHRRKLASTVQLEQPDSKKILSQRTILIIVSLESVYHVAYWSQGR
jgi:hypothetical protein